MRNSKPNSNAWQTTQYSGDKNRQIIKKKSTKFVLYKFISNLYITDLKLNTVVFSSVIKSDENLMTFVLQSSQNMLSLTK